MNGFHEIWNLAEAYKLEEVFWCRCISRMSPLPVLPDKGHRSALWTRPPRFHPFPFIPPKFLSFLLVPRRGIPGTPPMRGSPQLCREGVDTHACAVLVSLGHATAGFQRAQVGQLPRSHYEITAVRNRTTPPWDRKDAAAECGCFVVVCEQLFPSLLPTLYIINAIWPGLGSCYIPSLGFFFFFV